MNTNKKLVNRKNVICKLILALSFVLFNFYALAQEQEIKKPEYVIISNNKIITKEQLKALGNKGLIKAMNKGVSIEKWRELLETIGDEVGDREFIIIIDLFTEEEKQQLQVKLEGTPKIEKKQKAQVKELKLNIGDIASDFSVQMVNNEVIRLSNLKGKVVLINYWATWCAPCLMEFAEFPEKILEPLKNKDFVLIPIAIGEKKEVVYNKIRKMKKYGVNFNVGYDPESEIWNQYATGAIPKNFIVDKNGVIKYISIGNAEGNVDKLAIEINKLLEE
ncbi:TlpA family protein disulfide reductase [Lacinutrix cladophorae]